MTLLEPARQGMAAQQLRRCGIANPARLEATASVRCESFVDKGLKRFAFKDSPLPISEGRPGNMVLENMVLEMGTGSSCDAAVLSRIANRIFTIERHAFLAETAQARFRALGFEKIEMRIATARRGDLRPASRGANLNRTELFKPEKLQ